MALLRKLALSISSRVVRWASPGCKQWARGLAREAAAIPNDWAALCWSVGSARVLLDRREEPLGSLAEVPKAAQMLVEEARSGGGRLWIAMCQVPLFLVWYADASTRLARFGCALVVCGVAVAAIHLLAERHRLKPLWKDDVYDEIGACMLFYRAELERQRYRTWIPSFLMLCYCVGLTLAQRGGVLRGEPWLSVTSAVGCLLAVPLFLHLRKTNLRRIERLDALLDENGSARSL